MASTLYTVYQQSNGIIGINVSESVEDSDAWLRARGNNKSKITFTVLLRTADLMEALAFRSSKPTS